MIPAEAVEAAAKAIYHPQPLYDEVKEEFTGHRPWEWLTPESQESLRRDARAALEAAATFMLAECDLMRWKLDALKEWADAMIDESYYPQYGRDVRSLLDVASADEAREIDAL